MALDIYSTPSCSDELERIFSQASCCENDKEHSELVGHHLLGCLLDAMYNPYIPMSY
jgi:hypothetical protein